MLAQNRDDISAVLLVRQNCKLYTCMEVIFSRTAHCKHKG